MKGREQAPSTKRLLVSQGDIEREWGIPTRDILSAVQAGRFPAPVWVNGRKRWFDRAEVEEFLSRRIR